MSDFSREELERMRKTIEDNAQAMSDAEASMSGNAWMFPKLKGDGSLIMSGTKINWNDKVMKAAVNLWDNAANTPDAAPDIWAELLYRDGVRIIPEVITVTTMFSAGELGWWHDVLYRSIANANVYTPEQYARNWELVATGGDSGEQ